MDKDIEELRRLLPAPVSADLPADRHRLLKEHLMQEITETSAHAAASPQRRRRLVVSLVAATAVAGAVAAGAVVALRDHPTKAPATQAQASHSPAAVLPDTPVGQFMNQVVLAAKRGTVTLRKDQFLYLKSRIAFRVTGDNNKDLGLDPLHDREIWLPGDPTKQAMIRENGSTDEFSGAETNGQLFAGLPTDPHKLLEKIYRDTAGAGDGPDQEAFVKIHDYLTDSLPSPEMLTALYQAAALIPGVEKVDATDAIGRHGVALALNDPVNGSRSEWIFDAKTYRYLGERQVQVEPKFGLKSGDVLGTTAVLVVAVVDKVGQTS